MEKYDLEQVCKLVNHFSENHIVKDKETKKIAEQVILKIDNARNEIIKNFKIENAKAREIYKSKLGKLNNSQRILKTKISTFSINQKMKSQL